MRRTKKLLTRNALLCAALCLASVQVGAQEAYRFQCTDYVSTDDGRAPQSAFTYDEDRNTFTVQASGTHNIAFKMDQSRDLAYYIQPSRDWYLVRGTNLSATLDQSTIWWFNGYNGGYTSPTYAVDNGDGTTLVLWDVRNTDNLNANMDFSRSAIFITANGASFIHAMGLTSPTGTSTISDINHYAKYEAAAIYPAIITTLGYTDATLTSEIKEQLDAAIATATETVGDDTDSEAGQQATAAIATATQTSAALGAEDYATAFAALQTLQSEMDEYEANAVSYAYETTASGIHAKMGDMHVRLMLYGDGLVRVHKSYNEEVDKESLCVIAEPDTTLAFSVTEDADAHTVRLSTNKVKVIYHLTTAQVEVQRADGTPLISEKESGSSFYECADGPYDSYQIVQKFALDSDEHIYGMGQIQDGLLDRRGQTYSLAQNNTKVCIPYFQSTKNYGLFWDNYSPTTFTDSEESTTFMSTGDEIDYYVMAGDDSDGVLAGMRTLTGKSPMIPLWNFGLYQSKERYTSSNEVMEVVRKYRNLGVPLDCIVQDWQYWGDNNYWNAMEFLNSSFSSYKTMIKYVHNKNTKFMISIWANFGPDTDQYAELDALGRLIPVESYPTGCGVHPYDAYGEGARQIYWDHLYDGLANKDIDAWWMDSSEPDYYDWEDEDLDYVTETGHTWRELRNAFPLVHVGGVHDHHREAESQGDPYIAGKRSSILTRSAFAGQQRYGANTWSGDVTASWSNLAAQIPAACNLSACGIPYWNSDIGGFFTGDYGGVDDPAWRRLYMRWMQFGTFTPMMRFHGCSTPREIYQFGSENDGIGDYDNILKYVKIRYRMLPYLYSTAWQVCKNDRTFMRALPVAFNTDTNGYDVTDEYMFGESFLVAPVLEDEAETRSVYLPAGEKWTDFWTGETSDGGQSVTKTVDTDIMPLYVKAGTILPWGPDVQYSTEQQWDSLEVRIYPGADGSFTLYEDECDGYNYEDGAYTEIPFTWDDATQTLTIGGRQGSFDGMLSTRTFLITRVDTERSAGDGHETRFNAIVNYDGSDVSVTLADGDGDIEVTVTAPRAQTAQDSNDQAVYSLSGVRMGKGDESLKSLSGGVYIAGKRKVAVK